MTIWPNPLLPYDGTLTVKQTPLPPEASYNHLDYVQSSEFYWNLLNRTNIKLTPKQGNFKHKYLYFCSSVNKLILICITKNALNSCKQFLSTFTKILC